MPILALCHNIPLSLSGLSPYILIISHDVQPHWSSFCSSNMPSSLILRTFVFMVSSAWNKYFLYTLPWLTLTYHFVLLLMSPPLRIFCGSPILSYSQWQLSVSITSLFASITLNVIWCLFNYLTFHFVALLPSLGLSTMMVGSLSAIVTDIAFSSEQCLVHFMCNHSKYALGKEENKDDSNHCSHAQNHTQLLSKWQWPKELGGLFNVSPTLCVM